MNDPTPPAGLIDWMRAMFGGGVTTLVVAGLARLLWHGQEAKAGRRAWIGSHLWMEIPTAIVMALVAEAAASWLELSPSATTGIIAVVSYLGPRGLRDVLDRWLTRKP